MGMTLEAILDRNGMIHLKEPITLDGPRRVIVEILDRFRPLVNLSQSKVLRPRSLNMWSSRYAATES